MLKKTFLIATFLILITVIAGAILVNANTEAQRKINPNQNIRFGTNYLSNDIRVKNLFSLPILSPTKTSSELNSFRSSVVNTEYTNILSFNSHNNSNSTATCYPVVDGGWSSWSSWSSCSASCPSRPCNTSSFTVEGTRTQTRQCNNPSPNCGGNSCSGSSTNTDSCTISCSYPECEPVCIRWTSCYWDGGHSCVCTFTNLCTGSSFSDSFGPIYQAEGCELNRCSEYGFCD